MTSLLPHAVHSIMELPDIHVRVLFDFDYTTRDGANVKIQEGEKLYLIRKTNEDWWQVIRNSGRPFYVPTSYVEEIPRTNSWSRVEAAKPKNPVQDNYRSRSCSVESQQTHENHKVKPTVPKRTVFDTSAKRVNSQESPTTMKLSAPEKFEDDEGSDYVNWSSRLSLDKETEVPDTTERSPSSIVNNVDRLIENISNNLMSVDDEYTNGYSHVSLRKCNLSRKEYEGQLTNLSNSLEELTQQIELKAKSIGSKNNENHSPKSSVKDKVRPRPQESSSFKHIPDLAKKYDEKGRLQYSGSFKTKHECDKLAKNYVLLASTKEEDMITETNNHRGKSNDDNNNVNMKKKITENMTKDLTANVTNEQDFHGVDGKNIEETFSPVSTEHDDKLSPLRNSFDSSAEDLDKNSSHANSRLTLSDKGSTDSLLDIDIHNSIQEESVCTTASDSLLQTSDTSEECLPGILRDDLSPEESKQRKKAALKRNNRVEYRVRYPIRIGSPPVPEENQQPMRELFSGWGEYLYSDGRIFFYNSKTGEKSWKPPRRRCNTDERSGRLNGSANNLYTGRSSPFTEVDDNAALVDQTGIAVPRGWRLETDAENGCQCYINIITGAKWFSSNDDEGRVYYFEENSSESSWTLPAIIDNSSSEKLGERGQSLPDDHVYSNFPVASRSTILSSENSLSGAGNSSSLNKRIAKSKSMILLENKTEEPPVPFSMKNWPQLSDGRMNVLMEGVLNKTKMTENGKRVRKNWSTSHVVLTELFLVFYKDAKQKACSRPEMSVDLNGALIDRGDKFSSRKNVYMISTVLGFQVLIQTDCAQTADRWLTAIQDAIKNLPSGFDSCPRLSRGQVDAEEVVPEAEIKKSPKVTRSKSIKAKNKDGSMEDLAVSSAERQTKIRARLKKFFNRRPTMELLVKKGIWKDEPAFGCYLDQVVPNESPKVPLFVQCCIGCIERSEENMKTDGLYRASGNLSQVQKIRLQVDQNNLSVISEEDDVHVLTGALKLFFRELKEPLIPYDLFDKAIKAGHNHNKKEKIVQFREITKALPTSNYDTLKFLLQHLLKVKKYKEFNRMHIPNLAIVFGPTLMWPKQESNNMALDLMQQNLVIECLLMEYDSIFR